MGAADQCPFEFWQGDVGIIHAGDKDDLIVSDRQSIKGQCIRRTIFRITRAVSISRPNCLLSVITATGSQKEDNQ
jgi:hypothetical protein